MQSFKLILLSLFTSQFCSAQNEVKYLPEHKGNWKNSVVINESFTPYKISAEEKKILLQQAGDATQLVKNFPGFITPMGMEMSASVRLIHMEDEEKAKLKSTTPLPLELSISLADYFNENGKIRVSSNTGLHSYINLFFNNPGSALNKYELFYGGLYDLSGQQLYFEPVVFKTYENAIVYSNHRMLFLQPGKKLWVAVTAKQYLEAQLFHNEQKIKSGSTDLQMVYNDIKKELKDLPPEDQNKPAYYNSEFTGKLSQLSLEKTPGTTAIVKLNPAYFDVSKPRTAFQLLVIELGFAAYDYTEPILKNDERYGNNQVQLYNFFSKFDFSRFQTLLK